ncbi:MAG: hypothetical protein Q8L47_05055, partial [bacterium]|nr:hypothetical protein [bacterium]
LAIDIFLAKLFTASVIARGESEGIFVASSSFAFRSTAIATASVLWARVNSARQQPLNLSGLNPKRSKKMKLKTKKFHLGDVLTITTGRLVSPRHIDGVYDILNFMTGDNLFTHQLPRAMDECKPYLFAQFPQFAMPEIQDRITQLDKMLKTKDGKAEPKKLVADWLAKQVEKYGKIFDVKPIPKGAHQVKNPIKEAVEMTGGIRKVIVAVV